MKKFFLVIVSLSGIIALSSFDSNSAINKKVLQSFHSEYGNPPNAYWVAYPHDDYVMFKQNDIMVRVEYDLHGNQLYAIRYFDAKYLPLPVLDNVQEQFPGKKIDGVTEVTTPNGMSYVIQVEDNKTFTTLISDIDGDIAIQNQIQKTS